MSRTYRFINSRGLAKVKHHIRPAYRNIFYYLFSSKSEKLNDMEDKKIDRKIARAFSDSKKGIMILKGPSWFHNLTSQRPHRREASVKLKEFKKVFNSCSFNELNNCEEDLGEYVEEILCENDILIESKPKREYWWW